MKLEIKFGYALCYCPLFEINDIEADVEDFGEQKDLAPDEEEPYGCGNMQFIPREPTKEVLDKYKINEKEYKIICDKLQEGLSFGSCCWCS